jgi:phosphatidylglycerophosphatase C
VTRIAAFDLDGTLTTRDCVVPFLREVAGTGRIVAGLLRRPTASGRALARRDRDALKQV